MPKPIKNKRPSQLYFALVVADKPLEDAKFEASEDCVMFITTGEVEKHDIIPRSTLRSIVSKFSKAEVAEGADKVAE